MSSTPKPILEKIRAAKTRGLKALDLSNPLNAKYSEKLIKFPAEIFELEHLESLNLRNNRLLRLPDELTRLTKLTTLNVSGNQFTTLPDALTQLTNLTTLDVSYNQFTTLPDALTQLTNLTSLDMSHNQLTGLPDELTLLANLTTLNISDNQLTTLSDALTRLTSLITLNVSGNQLTRLPDTLVRLTHLSALNVSQNQLTALPYALSRLTTLTTLNIGANEFSAVPEWIGNFKKLTSFSVRWCYLTKFPEWITCLTALTTLNISDNQIAVLPNTIVNLTNLTALDVSYNPLTGVPAFISQLHNLKQLSLVNTQLTAIPEAIYELFVLEELYLNHTILELHGIQITDLGIIEVAPNQIKEISPKILQLNNLKKLQLGHASIETPPPEIVNLDKEGYADLEKIKNYFRQLEQEGKDYLYEAKLLIIGEGGAGKTTLRKKMVNPNYQLDDDEVSTEGIEVMQWNFPIEGGKQFRVNIWDFGGQEIYHATHQFFLTKRSLYALVADTRKEDTDFYYWLNVVELLSDHSPLLIIKNEKQDRHREINERQLRGQFANLEKTLATNLANNRGLPEILAEIKHYISHLPHIGTELPKTWVSVRKALENDPRNYISLDEYLKICAACGISDRNFELQLLGYLHDLGVCLHFQNDPLLKKTVILKPSWGTAAVYKVLDNKIVIHRFGQFTQADLARIWHEETYLNMHDELLQLMINFELCYQLPGSPDTYIAPQLLTENQPRYKWPEQQNLILRYTYEFMPKGILTRFIVAMHQAIADQRSVWKTGVILGKDETLAEVIEYYDRREIKIRIAGKHKKELLTIVMYELDKIHAAYNRLKYSKLIPCHCEQCKPSQEPHFYPFDILRKFIADRQAHIQCPKSYRMVNVRALIDDVMGKDAILTDPAKPVGGERRKQQELKNSEAQWELVNAKLSKLATAFVLETQPAAKFQLEQQIEEVKKEKAAIEAQLQALE